MYLIIMIHILYVLNYHDGLHGFISLLYNIYYMYLIIMIHILYVLNYHDTYIICITIIMISAIFNLQTCFHQSNWALI